jgi:hypothetical protein
MWSGSAGLPAQRKLSRGVACNTTADRLAVQVPFAEGFS